ncbi:hypothetical protein JCM30204_15570 [Dysgonomonas termitidis]
MESGKRYYDHTLVADKHFFGGYFNLAQNNIDLIFDSYKERFNENGKTENVIDKLKNIKLSDSEFKLKVEYLSRFFPFINYLDKTNREDFGEKLKLLVKNINDLRNFYTHYYQEPLCFDENFYTTLDHIFLKTVKDVRKNRLKTDESKLLLKTRLKDELETLFKIQKKKLLEEKAKGRNVFLDEESIRNNIYNQAFHHLIYKNRDTEEESIDRYYRSKPVSEESFAENNIAISRNGLIFLLSLFLTKKENENLRAQIKGFKAKITSADGEGYPNLKYNSLKNMVTHWVFSHLSFKGLKNQLSSTYNKETLLIQIADELSKVPDAVYNALPKELQETFVEDINEYIKEGNETYQSDELTVIHPVIRKRYENKFNYFALRYLDEFVKFPSLRFQIYLGNYIHDRRQKEIGGTPYYTERIVKDKINVFARLSEVSKLKGDYFHGTAKEPAGWEVFPNPSYNIEGGNIMVYLSIDKNLKSRIEKYRNIRNKNEKRKSNRENRIAKYEITRKIGGKSIVNYDEPVAVLSLNELPALLYELLIKKAAPEDIEKRIHEHVEEQFSKLENYKQGDRLPVSQIPQKLLKSSDTSSIDTDMLISEIEKEIEITRKKINLIKNNRAETKKTEKGRSIRKFIFNNKERGEEATWIAYDLVRYMPADIRKGWKGYQHSQLQQSLSFYDTRPNEALGLLEAVWDFNNSAYLWNVGIKEAFKKKDFDCFFEKYLDFRSDIYNNIKTSIISSGENKKVLNKALKQYNVKNLFSARDFHIDATQEQKEKLLAKPIVLSRGIFDKKPTYIKGVNIHDNPELFADWYQYANNTGHSFQRFYDYGRDYKELFKQDQLNRKKNVKSQ